MDGEVFLLQEAIMGWDIHQVVGLLKSLVRMKDLCISPQINVPEGERRAPPPTPASA